MITYVARERHFIDHLAPIWGYTGGEFLVPAHLREYAKKSGVDVTITSNMEMHIACATGPVVVASIGDYNKVSGTVRPLVLVNHGVGQTFKPNHPSYSGGPGRDGIKLFIEPNDRAAAETRRIYKDAEVVVAGSAKMDEWANASAKGYIQPTVAISFHWNGLAYPETRSAFEYYKAILPKLSKQFKLLGHGHPRIFPMLEGIYKEMGIESVENFDEVMRRADVYCCDGVSTLYEFAALNRPVVVLNAPWFRRNVEHGLRFWEYADVGVQVEYPDQLESAIREALEDSPEQRRRRQYISSKLFPNFGAASLVAGDAIKKLDVDGLTRKPHVEIFRVKPNGPREWEVRGTVAGMKTAVVFSQDTEPNIHDCMEALRNSAPSTVEFGDKGLRQIDFFELEMQRLRQVHSMQIDSVLARVAPNVFLSEVAT